MNLELPFAESDTSALDEYLAEIDHELDALFLDEVNGVMQRIRTERDVPPDIVAA